MTRTVAVVDLTSGTLSEREGETLTLDLPPDFDRNTGGVFVDADRLGRYRTAGGETCVYVTQPTPLSVRAAGEECLVAMPEVDSLGAACVRRYWRSLVEPTR